MKEYETKGFWVVAKTNETDHTHTFKIIAEFIYEEFAKEFKEAHNKTSENKFYIVSKDTINAFQIDKELFIL